MDAQVERISGAITALVESSWALYALAALVMMVGLILWARGGRLGRWTTGIFGAMTLGSAGWTLAAIFEDGAQGPHPWQGLLAGVVFGAVLGSLARGYILTSGCAAAGCALSMGIAVVVIGLLPERGTGGPIVRATPDSEHAMGGASSNPALDEATVRTLVEHVRAHPTAVGTAAASDPARAMRPLTSIVTDGGTAEALAAIGGGRRTDGLATIDILRSGTGTPLPAGPESAVARTGGGTDSALGALWLRFSPAVSRASKVWGSMTRNQRGVVAGAGVAGLAAGAIVGACAGIFGATLLSSLIGAAIWLAGCAWMLAMLGGPARDVLDRTPVQWAAIWAVAAALGLCVQGLGGLVAARRRRAMFDRPRARAAKAEGRSARRAAA